MAVIENMNAIIQELAQNANRLDEGQLQGLASIILKSKHIYLKGAGRSGVFIQAFANRLMHLGLSVSIVGDITNPHTGPENLLIIGSGSGETESLVSLGQKAKKQNVSLALITMAPQSTLGRLADVTAVVPGASPKLKDGENAVTSIQPMGSMFEQSCMLLYDAMILELMDKMQENAGSMFGRHADLE